MKTYSTNQVFWKLFIQQNCSQVEMGHRIDLDKNSVHDWLKGKNQMKFNKLEEVAKQLNKKVTIIIEDL
jgi:transcriptional regulator with XRE-family HTH domain